VKVLQGSNSRWIFPSQCQVLDAIQEDSNTGWCIRCGAEHDGLEPDAERRKCEECGKPAVYAAEECLLQGLYVSESAGE